MIKIRQSAQVSLLPAMCLLLLSACKPVVNYMAFYPDAVNLPDPASLPAGVEEITVTTTDAVKLHCLQLLHPGSDHILIYFHGNAGNVYQRLPALQQLQAMGINVIGVGYRGYGRSEGSPSEVGIYTDGEAVLDYVTQKLGFPYQRIILFGRSIGTTVAVYHAQQRSLAGLLLVTPLTSGRAHAEATGLGAISSLAGDAFDNLGRIKHLQAPLLVILGTEDEIIPFAMGQEIYQSAPVSKTLVQIEGGRHNDLQDRFGEHYWGAIRHFIQQRVQDKS